jgi:outer membrane protein assembly factor BamD
MRIFKFIGVLALLGLFGCSATEVVDSRPPEDMYAEAGKAFEDHSYKEAGETLAKLRERHPFSPLAVDAELLQADIEFASENYEAAAAAYSTFEELHPFHKNVDHAIFRRAECYYQRIDAEDRDQTPAHSALETYRRLLSARPDSTYAAQAKARVAEVREELAAHELYVARFYFRRGKYDSALERLKGLSRDYPETKANAEGAALIPEVEVEKQKIDAEQAEEGKSPAAEAPKGSGKE